MGRNRLRPPQSSCTHFARVVLLRSLDIAYRSNIVEHCIFVVLRHVHFATVKNEGSILKLVHCFDTKSLVLELTSTQYQRPVNKNVHTILHSTASLRKYHNCNTEFSATMSLQLKYLIAQMSFHSTDVFVVHRTNLCLSSSAFPPLSHTNTLETLPSSKNHLVSSLVRCSTVGLEKKIRSFQLIPVGGL